MAAAADATKEELGAFGDEAGVKADAGAIGDEAKELVASEVKPPDLRRTKKLHALLLSKYDEVLGQAEAMGWTTVSVVLGDEEPVDYNLCWSDTSVSLERVMRMSRMQRINHFPGMLELVRKAGTARNLNKMLQAVGTDYKFFPRTFLLPADYTELKQEFQNRKGQKTFIVKPSKGAQGTGIILTRSLSDIDPQEPNIVQRYMHRPHLLDGYKYDLRLYVLLTSLQPLRIFLFREGLVRRHPRRVVATCRLGRPGKSSTFPRGAGGDGGWSCRLCVGDAATRAPPRSSVESLALGQPAAAQVSHATQ
jgi:hypothetical protein